MDCSSSYVSDNKENIITHLRNQVDNWREQRYGKLNSRLMKGRQGNENGSFVSPSVLGVKCPKNLIERFRQPNDKDIIGRKTLSDLQPNAKNVNSGDKRIPRKRFSKGPPVRQTVTSNLRMLHNNPLMDISVQNNFSTSILHRTVIRTESINEEIPEAFFSTPAVGNNHPQFPDSMSEIKRFKAPTEVVHSKTFLKYD